MVMHVSLRRINQLESKIQEDDKIGSKREQVQGLVVEFEFTMT